MPALTYCFSLLGGARGLPDRGQTWACGGQLGTMLAHFSLLSGSWVHFLRLAAFVAPFGRFFHDLGRSSLDFGAPSWPYVGTHFALDGIFRHAAGIAAKKPCWHSLSAFRFHYAARRYVQSTSAASRRECLACRIVISFIFLMPASKACFQN